jgi:hypothetical protein
MDKLEKTNSAIISSTSVKPYKIALEFIPTLFPHTIRLIEADKIIGVLKKWLLCDEAHNNNPQSLKVTQINRLFTG